MARKIIERYELMEKINKNFPYTLHIIEKLEEDGVTFWEERWDTNKPLPLEEYKALKKVQEHWLMKVV